MSNSGWISLHRKIKEHWVWQDSLYLKIWIDFLLRANHDNTKIVFDNNLVEVKRGTFITSLKKLAMEYSVSISKIRTLLKNFENDSMIELKSTHKMTQITICNYETYQENPHTERKQKENRKKTERKQKDTDNNDNNDNNENNDNKKRDINNTTTSSEINLIIWRSVFLSTPGIVELDFVSFLVQKFGEGKAKEILYAFKFNNFHSIKSMSESLNEDGSIKPKEVKNNGRYNSTAEGLTAIAIKHFSDEIRE